MESVLAEDLAEFGRRRSTACSSLSTNEVLLKPQISPESPEAEDQKEGFANLQEN